MHALFLFFFSFLHFHFFSCPPLPLAARSTKLTRYWPGAISRPFFCASCSQPPVRAVPPFCAVKSLIRASSSGRKCLIRPWIGQANASPSAVWTTTSQLCGRGRCQEGKQKSNMKLGRGGRKETEVIERRRTRTRRKEKKITYRKSNVPQPASSAPASCRSPSRAPGPSRSAA